MKKYMPIVLALLAFIAGCDKEEAIDGPEIVITSPSPGEEFDMSDSVLVVATITDPDMHGYELYAVDKDNLTDTLFQVPFTHSHDDVTINQRFAVSVSDHTDAILTVRGENHNEFESSKEVQFHIHPM